MEKEELTAYLKKELEEAKAQTIDGEELESLKLEENVPTKFTILLDEEFKQWTDKDGKIKKIIMIEHGGVKKKFWLNVANPCYKSILEQLATGNNTVTILRTGTQADTRYTLLKPGSV